MEKRISILIFLICQLAEASSGFMLKSIGPGVTGPSSSLTNSIAVFCDSTGGSICDSQAVRVINIPGGVPNDEPSGLNGKAGLQFIGPNVAPNTGFLSENVDSIGTFLELLVAGQQYFLCSQVATGAPECVLQVNLRPDAGPPTVPAHVLTVGLIDRPWATVFTHGLVFGGNTNGFGYSDSTSTVRSLWFTHGAWQGGGIYEPLVNAVIDRNTIGLGFDGALGNEFYLSMWDSNSSLYYETLNVKYSGLTTTISAPVSPYTDSNNGISVLIKGADKGNSGTGDGGDVILGQSASVVGGNPGNVFIPSISGGAVSPHSVSGSVPLWFDPSNNKFCVKSAASVICTQMN